MLLPLFPLQLGVVQPSEVGCYLVCVRSLFPKRCARRHTAFLSEGTSRSFAQIGPGRRQSYVSQLPCIDRSEG